VCPSAKPLYREQRKLFIAQYCTIVKGVPVTKCDYKFASLSIAVAMFIGGSENGWTEWKDAEGKILSKVYRK